MGAFIVVKQSLAASTVNIIGPAEIIDMIWITKWPVF
jgi:hypothetical protein